jgi:hypothetical protein
MSREGVFLIICANGRIKICLLQLNTPILELDYPLMPVQNDNYMDIMPVYIKSFASRLMWGFNNVQFLEHLLADKSIRRLVRVNSLSM